MLDVFVLVTVVDVVSIIRRLPDKSCAADALPTPQLNETRLRRDRSVLCGAFQSITVVSNRAAGAFKSSFIAPLLKKPDVSSDDSLSYRPISNLLVVLKLHKRLVFGQLYDYPARADLPRLQSAYRSHHSTETALLKVLADILLAADNGELFAFALLDLSAAFDTVDHDILLTRLRVWCGVGGPVLDWFRSYLTDRIECFLRGMYVSIYDNNRMLRSSAGIRLGSAFIHSVHG